MALVGAVVALYDNNIDLIFLFIEVGGGRGGAQRSHIILHNC